MAQVIPSHAILRLFKPPRRVNKFNFEGGVLRLSGSLADASA